MKRSLKEMRSLLGKRNDPSVWHFAEGARWEFTHETFNAAAPEMVADLLGVVEELRSVLAKSCMCHALWRDRLCTACTCLAKLDADGAGCEG